MCVSARATATPRAAALVPRSACHGRPTRVVAAAAPRRPLASDSTDLAPAPPRPTAGALAAAFAAAASLALATAPPPAAASPSSHANAAWASVNALAPTTTALRFDISFGGKTVDKVKLGAQRAQR